MTSICRRDFWSYEVVCKLYFILCFVVNSHFVQDGERCSRERLLAALWVFSKKESFVVHNHESNIMRTSHTYSWFSQLFYLRLRQLHSRLTVRLWMTKQREDARGLRGDYRRWLDNFIDRSSSYVFRLGYTCPRHLMNYVNITRDFHSAIFWDIE